MKITILAEQVINQYGVFKRGDKTDIPEKDARPMLDCLNPSAVEGWVKLPVKGKPKPKKPTADPNG